VIKLDFMDRIRKEVDDDMELEFPIIKWSKGEEYAVLHNRTGKPITEANFSVSNPPKKIEFLREFDNLEEALEYQEYLHMSEYGGIGLIDDPEFDELEKKFGPKPQFEYD
tara:strand:- start:3171 stop:3500 length:330 start_codon:yes stop_codon:yes gene_type:complete